MGNIIRQRKSKIFEIANIIDDAVFTLLFVVFAGASTVYGVLMIAEKRLFEGLLFFGLLIMSAYVVYCASKELIKSIETFKNKK